MLTLETPQDAEFAAQAQAGLDAAERLLDEAGVPVEPTPRHWVAVWMDGDEPRCLREVVAEDEVQARQRVQAWWQQWFAQGMPDGVLESDLGATPHAAFAEWLRAGGRVWPVQEYVCQLLQPHRHGRRHEAELRLQRALDGTRKRVDDLTKEAQRARLQAQVLPRNRYCQRQAAAALCRMDAANQYLKTLELVRRRIRPDESGVPADVPAA